MVEEAVKVEAVGGVALEESVQEVAQLGRGSARNPERNGANGTVILVGGCVSVRALSFRISLAPLACT